MLYLDTYLANINMVVRIADYLSCGPGDVWASDKAEFEQNKFYYITKGRCVIKINGVDHYGQPGSWFFIPANTKHSYYNLSDEPFEKYWLHFDLYPNSTIFRLLDLDYCIQTEEEAVRSLFDELLCKYRSGTLTDQLDVKSLVIRILSAYIAASDKETKIPSSPDWEEKISAVLSYINQNLGSHISNAELSELCYLHPNHFVRFFKKKTGMTPQKYIMERRVQMAKRLIDQTDLKFSDIAAQVGLCDAPHLSKVFKKYYALSPQDYRSLRTGR